MLKAEVHKLRGFSPKERDLFLEALDLCIEVFESREFYRAMRHYDFIKTRGRSGREIWREIHRGNDYNQESDKDIDIDATLYYEDNNVIGFVKGGLRSWINKKFFLSKRRGAAGRASNLAHELMHKLKYSHSRHWNPTRKHTVPYAVGYIVRDIAKDILKDRKRGNK